MACTSYDGSLVVIENGMVPQRVMRLKLAQDGRSVDRAMPLDVAQAGVHAADLGAIAGDATVFHRQQPEELYDTYGVLKDAAKLEPVKIFRANLRFAWDRTRHRTGHGDPQRSVRSRAIRRTSSAAEKSIRQRAGRRRIDAAGTARRRQAADAGRSEPDASARSASASAVRT